MISPHSTSGFTSLFQDNFDLGIIGAGYLGTAAVQIAAQQGLRVLVIEPTGQLLWETSRSLENRLGPHPQAAWCQPFLQTADDGVSEGYLDAALAEVALARGWSDGTQKSVRVLFYARPVAVTRQQDQSMTVTVATKGELHTVRARRWIDASETGCLVQLLDRTLTGRLPTQLWHSITFQSKSWVRYEEAIQALGKEQGWHWLRSARKTERRLVWENNPSPWHQQVVKVLQKLRTAVPGGDHWIVSQCSCEPYPVYEAQPRQEKRNTNNQLLCLSPSFSQRHLKTISDRYLWAEAETEAWINKATLQETTDQTFPSIAEAIPSRNHSLSCDVLVAGSGTAGALAALAAAQQGAQVLSVDFAPFPGGVGTGGGIAGYFHGLEGGLQSQTDQLTGDMNLLLEGKRRDGKSWHHEGKKLALLHSFEKHGVTFLPETIICGAEKDEQGKLRAVLAANRNGLLRLEAKTFIDSTGDGDLCVSVGAQFQSGREGDSRTLAYSQASFALRSKGDALEIYSQNFDAGWTDPTDPEDLSRARLEGVAQYWKPNWYGANPPLALAPLPGIRQSRHMETDYVLRFADLVNHASFPDSIGMAGSIADTHSVDYEFEADEACFFYWTCRLFRHPLQTDLPYRMLLPRGLDNVWIACRAAGINATAAYAVRMQRDMQRLGEVAGVAAALAAQNSGSSRQVDLEELSRRLQSPLAREASSLSVSPPGAAPLQTQEVLQDKQPGIRLWQLYSAPHIYQKDVLCTLASTNPNASFYAAALLAMWERKEGEARLTEAVAQKELGPAPSSENTGAFGQEIDVPFWLQAVVLLRRSGTERCMPVLLDLAGDPDLILNVRTALALTFERLALRHILTPTVAADAVTLLVSSELPESMLPLSRSIWRHLRKEEPVVLRNTCEVKVQQDHAWQLYLVVSRARMLAGLQLLPEAQSYLKDDRAIVRQAFTGLLST